NAVDDLNWPFTAEDDQLLVDGERLGSSITFQSERELLEYSGRSYHGDLQVVASEGKVLLINRLGLEEYLKGVIPAEMHADWHPEALKAQAVAARSYVLHQLDPGE